MSIMIRSIEPDDVISLIEKREDVLHFDIAIEENTSTK
jgi:hypothetical protein